MNQSPTEYEPLPADSNWSPKLLSSILGCVVGIGIAIAVVHIVHPIFPFADLPELGLSPSPELLKQHNDAKTDFYQRNYAAELAVIGVLLGACVGLFAANRRRMLACSMGGVAGLAGGTLGGWVGGIYVAKAMIASSDQSLVQSVVLHAGVWSVIAGVVSMAVGWAVAGVRTALNSLITGIFVGIAAAVCYNVGASAIFSSGNLMKLVPEKLGEQVGWGILIALTLGLGLHYGLRPRKGEVKELSHR